MVEFPWQVRSRQTLFSFIQSDEFISDLSDAVVPESRRPLPVRMGPLAVVPIWPSQLASDIIAARQKTLFLVHLLAPHAPYLFHKDGTLRANGEGLLPRRNFRYGDYLEQQRRYAEQVQYVSSQVRRVFDRLRRAGIYDAMTIIVHGDHGSRIRWLDPAARGHRPGVETAAPGEDVEEYYSPPRLQDLLNRYSALLAIKEPYSAAGAIDGRKISVVKAVAEDVRPDDVVLGRDADQVYIFAADGRPRAIPILDYWTDASAGEAK